MKLTMKYAQYEKIQNFEPDCINDIELYMRQFAKEHGLTETCWITFTLEGEFNVKTGEDKSIPCLFG